MKKITIVINTPKDVDLNRFREMLGRLNANELAEVLLIRYNNLQSKTMEYPVFSVDNHDDISFSLLLQSITTDQFIFINPDLEYPTNFFSQLLTAEEKQDSREKGGVWTESLIAVQQSHYGLCGKLSGTKADFSFLNESVLYTKKEIETLNTDKLDVHSDSAKELYRYAIKKKIAFVKYAPEKKKVNYHIHFTDLMFACQKQAQKEFKLFPALFVLFFLIFGFGAALNPVLFLIFLLGMSAYFMAITLESFGLSSIKQNGGLVPVLLLLFPFIHLVYGLESWIARFKSKA